MNWLINIGLNLIGTWLFFTDRYLGRTDKTKKFDWKFWWRSNNQEIITTALLNTAFMLIIYQSVQTDNADTLLTGLPNWVSMFGVPGICFGLGAGFSWTIYELFKSKRKDVECKNVS
jgi:hypothetical protein